MVRRRAGIVALAVTVAIGLAGGCGGDDDAGAGGGSGADGSGGMSTGGDSGSGGGGDGAGKGEVPDDLVVMDGSEVRVASLDNTFRVANIQVEPGTTVTWTNDGRNEHDVLPVDGGGWGVEVAQFQPGDSYQHTFDEPGVHRYYCSIHGTTTAGMIGTVVVAE
jgi:plastocyanin